MKNSLGNLLSIDAGLKTVLRCDLKLSIVVSQMLCKTHNRAKGNR
jgi:hypothetical protein